MTEYPRFDSPGATWFFTVTLAEREGNRRLVDRIEAWRAAFVTVGAKPPFRIDATTVLPDPLHDVLTLPIGEPDVSTRWGLIKEYFSRHIEKGERISNSRRQQGERGLWQRRFWEHLSRDNTDYPRQLDDIPWNWASWVIIFSSLPAHMRIR